MGVIHILIQFRNYTEQAGITEDYHMATDPDYRKMGLRRLLYILHNNFIIVSDYTRFQLLQY